VDRTEHRHLDSIPAVDFLCYLRQMPSVVVLLLEHEDSNRQQKSNVSSNEKTHPLSTLR